MKRLRRLFRRSITTATWSCSINQDVGRRTKETENRAKAGIDPLAATSRGCFPFVRAFIPTLTTDVKAPPSVILQTMVGDCVQFKPEFKV